MGCFNYLLHRESRNSQQTGCLDQTPLGETYRITTGNNNVVEYSYIDECQPRLRFTARLFPRHFRTERLTWHQLITSKQSRGDGGCTLSEIGKYETHLRG